jgi:RNA polymerase sigma-70 factor (family 1)
MHQQNPEYLLFESLFRQHFQQLAGYAFTILRNKDDAEDVVQEVFTRIWNKNRDALRLDQPKYYLVTAVKNACISLLRKQAGKQFVPVENVAIAAEQTSTPAGTDLVIIANKALAELPPQCLAIFKLSRFGKLTYQQIADEMGLSVKTIENQMGKAIRIMREFAKKNEVHFTWLMILAINILKYTGW